MSPRPLKQKIIGILGGMSDKATISGANFGNIEYFVRNNLWDEMEAYIEEKALALKAAGADLIICVSNTNHKVLPKIMERIRLAFIHIFNTLELHAKAAVEELLHGK